jgi:hypothetical protein
MNEQATMQEPVMQGHMLPLKDWAELHQVSIRTVHNYLAAEKLSTATKLNGSWLINADEPPPTKGAGKGAPMIVVGENADTRPAAPAYIPAHGGAMVPVNHSLIHGTEPVDAQTMRESLDDYPLWIEPAVAAHFIGVTEHALRNELADEYGGRIIGRKLLFPQKRIREEYMG